MRSVHLDDARVQEMLHGELAPSSEVAVREHLAECVTCRDRVAAASREEADVFALLGALDHPAPPIGARAVALRARTPDVRRLKWAAGIVLALGVAGIAYAAPGSPLPRWVSALTGWVRPAPVAVPTPSAPSPPRESTAAGVAVTPGARLVIAFTSTQAQSTASVRLTDGAQVVVQAPSGVATFSSEDDRLVIDNRSTTAAFEIQIPRLAPRVEIHVDGDRRFIKDGDRIMAIGPRDARDAYTISLARTQ